MKRLTILSTLTVVLSLLAFSCTKPSPDDPNKGNQPETPETPQEPTPEEPTPVVRELHVYQQGKEIKSLCFDANEETTEVELTVEANFYWDLDIQAEWPVWIVRPGITDGKKGDDGVYRNTFKLSLNATELDGTDRSGVLTFDDIDDAAYTFAIPVSYKAKVIPEVPFKIVSELGTDIHVNKAGVFKDASGNPTSKVMLMSFDVQYENPDELIVIIPSAIRHEDGACFIQTESRNRFASVITSEKIEGGVRYTLYVTPIVLDSADPKSPCDMAYVIVLPKFIYEPYEKFIRSNDVYYEMPFMYMKIDNYLFQLMRDAEGNQVNDANGPVYVQKDSVKKYMLRLFIDAE